MQEVYTTKSHSAGSSKPFGFSCSVAYRNKGCRLTRSRSCVIQLSLTKGTLWHYIDGGDVSS